jgi:PAS domain S-box-containing protein
VNTTPKALFSIAAAVLLLVAGMVFAAWSYHQIEDASNQRRHTRLVINDADDFLSAVKDAETGMRGYALTSNEAYLQPYLAVFDELTGKLKAMRQLTSIVAAQVALDTLAPLIDAKLTQMAKVIELRHTGDTPAVLALINTGDGMLLMDSIRSEMKKVVQLEEAAQLQHDADFDTSMRRLLAILVAFGLLMVLLSIAFAYLIYQQTQQRLKDHAHLLTRQLLDLRNEANQQLLQINRTLQVSEEKLAVTLYSIGDAVIATDASACVTLLNPVAEDLTGWTQAQAMGRPVDEVFHIINKETRQLATIPVADALAHGTVQGLANHTVLIARDGREFDIADSCAPIRDRDAQVVGAVLVFRNVTEEYAVQRALRDSNALVQTILSTVEDGIITIRADSSAIETLNPATVHMFGYKAEELVGKPFSLLVPELDKTPSNGSLAYYSASDAARASGLAREVIAQRKDGSLFPMELVASEMQLDGERYFTGVLRDITARKQAQEALQKTGALQSAIFNSANFSSIATDARGVIQIFNVGAERMLGYTAAEVLNIRTPADISDPQEVIERAKALSVELATEIAPGFEALVFKAARGIEDIYELTYIRKDGSRFPAVVSVTALRDAQDAIIGYLLIGTDNTARKQIEEERARLDQVLKDKNVELENARALAEKANLAKSDFLSSMSHELRTPLGAILGFAQLMESGAPAPTINQKRSIDQILKAGWYLLDLINEILDLALIESGKLSLSMESVSLNDVLSECETMIEPQANKYGIRVTFTHDQHPQFVKADRTRFKQVLINLLSNAIKYNKAGGEVNVDCVEGPNHLIRISVRDTGAGLEPDQLSQLFQPFNRLGQKAKVEEGTGIGLVVCKQLVELMEGEIGFESTVDVGSVFWFQLNSTTPPQFVLPLVEHVSAEQAKVILTSHTLLYVEDNPANLMLIEDLIARRPDVRLLTAKDGPAGLKVARAYLPNVILMDINLPGISGVDAMKILAKDPSTQHIPVIALSANAIPRDIERGIEAGFFRYLTKPIKVNQLLETLDLAFQFSTAQASGTAEKEQA